LLKNNKLLDASNEKKRKKESSVHAIIGDCTLYLRKGRKDNHRKIGRIILLHKGKLR
jgi:hypothetical protein